VELLAGMARELGVAWPGLNGGLFGGRVLSMERDAADDPYRVITAAGVDRPA
jgi:hypothetical protein